MSIIVDDVIQVKMVLYDTRFPGDRYLNVLKYRVYEGSAPDEILAGIHERFKTVVWDRIMTVLLTTTGCAQLRCQKIHPVETWEHVITPQGWGQGALTPVQTSPPQASACLTRRSYVPGRKGIGRLFFGPLAEGYCQDGYLLPDPATAPDLQIIADAFGDGIDNISDPEGTSGFISMKPIVWGGTGPVSSKNDVRSQDFAPALTYMKTRRAGVGS